MRLSPAAAGGTKSAEPCIGMESAEGRLDDGDCKPSTGAIAAGPCTTAAALGRLGMMPAMAASCGHVKSGSSGSGLVGSCRPECLELPRAGERPEAGEPKITASGSSGGTALRCTLWAGKGGGGGTGLFGSCHISQSSAAAPAAYGSMCIIGGGESGGFTSAAGGAWNAPPSSGKSPKDGRLVTEAPGSESSREKSRRPTLNGDGPTVFAEHVVSRKLLVVDLGRVRSSTSSWSTEARVSGVAVALMACTVCGGTTSAPRSQPPSQHWNKAGGR
mmetsp:Transcript_46915/g.109395  ORF Transcript_46915/g.109395 Transcript_46915/m.109395 type:complete len:274 (-) Transcript_46915:5293-6114(-)